MLGEVIQGFWKANEQFALVEDPNLPVSEIDEESKNGVAEENKSKDNDKRHNIRENPE